MSELNPQVTVVTVGTKKLREVTIYPLSMADQFKMTDMLVSAFNEFSAVAKKKKTDAAIVASAIKIIEDNLQDILKLVVDESESVTFDDLTNTQFSDLIDLVYEVNYAPAIKKLQSLVSKVKAVLPKPKKQD